jgi:hypothetical protein
MKEKIKVGEFILVKEDKEFKFKNICPYCSGDLTYVANGWEQDENDFWKADCFDMECSSEPNVESEEWEDWMRQHSDMPYVNQLPVDEKVKEYINSKYRFDV